MTRTDIDRNTRDVDELQKELVVLKIKCEILTNELKTIQKLVYGVVSIILTAVVIALTSNVII